MDKYESSQQDPPAAKNAPTTRPRYKKPLTAQELAELPDEDIDYSDIPPLTEEFWENAVLTPPLVKSQISFRVDRDILDFFKRQGSRGYQTRMHQVLRAYVDAHKNKP